VFTIIFDATPRRDETLGVNIRFVDSRTKKICVRALALKLYKSSFDNRTLSAALINLVLCDYKLQLTNWKFLIGDGCAVNVAAVASMSQLLTASDCIVCVSHAMNIVGQVFEEVCTVAARFEQSWSNMINKSYAASSCFKRHAGVTPLTENRVRWFSWWEVIRQITTNFDSCRKVIEDEGDFCQSIRNNLKSIVTTDYLNLRLELALLVDVGRKLTSFCYFQEGDQFLSVTTYSHWHEVMSFLRMVQIPENCKTLAPELHGLATQIAPSEYREVINQTLVKVGPLYEKMRYDTFNRLANTLNIFRACRLLNYVFVSETTLQALCLEFEQLQQFSAVSSGNISYMEAYEELELYKDLADNECLKDKMPNAFMTSTANHDTETNNRLSYWNFWLTHGPISLPTLFKIACEAAIISPSSASVERLFSTITHIMSSDQGNALEDYVWCAGMLRFNSNSREREEKLKLKSTNIPGTIVSSRPSECSAWCTNHSSSKDQCACTSNLCSTVSSCSNNTFATPTNTIQTSQLSNLLNQSSKSAIVSTPKTLYPIFKPKK